jgi:hypothetical protein
MHAYLSSREESALLVAWVGTLIGALAGGWALLRACLIADIGGNPHDSPMRQLGLALLGAGIWLAATFVAALAMGSPFLPRGAYLGGKEIWLPAMFIAALVMKSPFLPYEAYLAGVLGLCTAITALRGVARWRHLRDKERAGNLRAAHRLQFSCQDLIVAVLCYGLGMALVALADVRRWMSQPERRARRLAASCSVHLYFMAFPPAALAGWLMWRSVHRQFVCEVLEPRTRLSRGDVTCGRSG